MELLSADLQRLFDDWSARAGNDIPRRRDFDPVELKYILGRLSVLEVHRNPLRFFYRLHGTDAARRVGFDQTGKYMDEAPDKGWATLACENLEEVVNTGVAIVTRRYDQAHGGRLWNLEVLVLPLSSDGVKLDMLFSAVAHYTRAEWAAGQLPHAETRRLLPIKTVAA